MLSGRGRQFRTRQLWTRQLWTTSRGVAVAMLMRLWQVVAGPVTAYLIASHFTPELQGLFYLFGALLAVQALFDLGLTGVLISLSTREWDAALADDAAARARLGELLRRSRAWFAGLAVGFALVVTPLGLWFLDEPVVAGINWQPAWVVASLATAAAVALLPGVGVIEGRFVTAVNVMRLAQAVLGNVVVWSLIAAGAGIWTVAASSVVRLLCEVALVAGWFGPLLRSLRRAEPPAGEEATMWTSTVRPLQWRIGIQSLANYLASQTFTLVVGKTDSVAAAGRMGMTWNILMAVQQTALAWLQVRLPSIGTAVAAGDVAAARSLLRRTVLLTGLFQTLGVVALVGLRLLLGQWRPDLADRLLDVGAIALFGLSLGLHNVLICWITYVRLYRIEPFVRPALIGTSVMAAAVLTGATLDGARGLAVAHLAVMLAVYYPLNWPVIRRELAVVEAAATEAAATEAASQ